MSDQAENEVLFQITRENLDTGMRGFPVGHCTTSSVDPQKGLFYRGIPVSTMVDWDPFRVIYLLYHGRDGSPHELKQFQEDLDNRSHISEKVQQHISQLPREGHPMSLFCAALLVAGMIEGSGDYQQDCLNIVAKIPLIAAAVINHHAGWGATPPSSPQLGYMENFVQMLRVPNVHPEQLIEAFRLFNILHYDHGGGNLSTFIGKGVSSGLADMYGSLAAAMCALAGPRHGRANQDCLSFVEEVFAELGEQATAPQVEALIRKRLANNQLVFGFGHAVLRVEDPRASLFYQVGQAKYSHHPLVKIALLLRSEGSKVMAENAKIADPHPNVDAISGTILSAAGFPYPDYFTILFGVSRCVGIARQIVYDRCEARGGKGTPIIRPKYLYKPNV